jgi:desampylase
MEADTLLVESRLLEGIVGDCLDRKPREVCGILLGDKDGRSVEIYEAIPTEDKPEGASVFTISQEDIMHIFKTLQQTGLHVIGTYISHPEGPATVSEKDKAAMLNPAFVWLVVGKDGSHRAYTNDGGVKEIKISIMPV